MAHNLFPLKKAYAFLRAQGLPDEAQGIRISRDRFGVLRSAKAVVLLRCKALLEKFIADWWPSGSSPEGRRHINSLARLYERSMKSKNAIEPTEPFTASEDDVARHTKLPRAK
jgi:hypothetical protein